LFGNIEFPSEVDHCVQCGAAGIGLYRTEFLYLDGGCEPTEQQHYEAYCRVARAFPGRPVVIRTLDLGAEKFPDSMQQVIEASPNPTLGLRSLRLTLQNLPMFKTQLRAILRAASQGDIRIMFPLVSTLLELRQAKWILADVSEDLQEEGIEHNPRIPVGMMVEVPSAAILADEFAREVDFFSIGTNDLIQYTLGVDRANPAVSHLYSSADPSVCRLIRQVVAAAERHRVSVSVCGQMSSDCLFTALLVGMGLRELSVSPNSILEVKQAVRSMTIAQAREIASRAEIFDVSRDLESYLRGELSRFSPELVH
jgi:phosphotransferase system enzyme I (PtsI)